MIAHWSDWKKDIKHRLAEPADAVAGIRRGQRVFIGSGAAEPETLVRALTARGSELQDCEIIHLLTLGAAPYAESHHQHSFRHNALFVGANVRQAVQDGRADYTPIFLSEIPRLFRSRKIHLDAVLVMVTPPDSHGYCSLGISVDIIRAAIDSADIVIAEINENMPRTHGDTLIHVSEIDRLTESNTPLLTSIPAEMDEVAMRIGRHVASLIGDGSTLQLGIGTLPNAVLAALGKKKNLGVHTEMFSDGVMDLIDQGVINGSRKSLLPGKIVSSFCIGSEKLYEFVHNNPLFEFRPAEFTNDPFVIAQNDKMVAVNAALEVDLTGQICADSIGTKFYSGIGGQVDFIRGAAHSKGGKPIIVLRSTARNDTISRIVPKLQKGAGVVTTRGDVHYVVTEYGIADLWGRTVRERTLALISIAHPKFREELMEEARKRRLVFEDQIVIANSDYPEYLDHTHSFKGDIPVNIRPVRPADENLMKGLFYDLTPESVMHRFFTMRYSLPHHDLQRFTNVDYRDNLCLIGVVADGEGERLIAVGEYHKDPASDWAEIAFLVHDDYQGLGIGSYMVKLLKDIADSNGIRGFTAEVLPDNTRMLKVFHKLGHKVRTRLSRGVYHLRIRFKKHAITDKAATSINQPQQEQ